MPKRRPTFTWNANASRYVDSRGRFVSPVAVRDALDKAIAKNSVRMKAAAEALRSGRISTDEWRGIMRRSLKDTHLYSAMAARGGKAQMTQADYGRVGAEVRFQYKRLDMFAVGIANGSVPLDGRFIRRADLYAQSGRTTYERTIELEETQRNGMNEYRNVLHPADHCTECQAITRAGWQPVGTLKPIGRRQCLGGCKCTWKFRKVRGRRGRVGSGEPAPADVITERERITAAGRALMLRQKAKRERAAAAIRAVSFTRDAAHPTLASVISAQEDAIRGNPRESGYAWGASGDLILAKQGSKNKVTFTEADTAKLIGAAVFTHNHPNGGPLSHDDFVFLRMNRIGRMRAVGIEPGTRRQVDFEVSRNAEFEPTPAQNALFRSELRKVYSRAAMQKEMERRLVGRERNTMLAEDRAHMWYEILHERLAAFIERDGRYTYTRTFKP